ncbi:hypothetical protein F5B18DRAFT_513270 [Nemania serpens]|nr:hypothetical protein F5B18DRAFT_513270 [Nemania serpens]
MFSIKRKSNLIAVLVQIAGVHEPPADACVRCKKGRGLWTGCITAPLLHKNMVHSACANCFYNGTGSKCSFLKPSKLFPY